MRSVCRWAPCASVNKSLFRHGWVAIHRYRRGGNGGAAYILIGVRDFGFNRIVVSNKPKKQICAHYEQFERLSVTRCYSANKWNPRIDHSRIVLLNARQIVADEKETEIQSERDIDALYLRLHRNKRRPVEYASSAGQSRRRNQHKHRRKRFWLDCFLVFLFSFARLFSIPKRWSKKIRQNKYIVCEAADKSVREKRIVAFRSSSIFRIEFQFLTKFKNSRVETTIDRLVMSSSLYVGRVPT